MNQVIPEPASLYFLPPALNELRDAILAHGGHEVFFVGRMADFGGKVQAVEVLCRGNANQVPAILDAARPGEVVIHNHPSGQLVPSEPDCALASHYGQLGVGFLICNNEGSAVVAVVKPHLKKPRQLIAETSIDERLGPEGELARTLPGYEHRVGQILMSHAVLRAFNRDGVTVVEAGTGTGKSLAYLLPSALHGLKNGESVVVATHTLNLQEQLFSKDAPQVTRLTGLEDVRVALLKGRSNYACNRKLEYHLQGPSDLFDGETRTVMESLGTWVGSTRTGMRSELSFPLPEGLWDRLAADEDDCARVKCPRYDACFYFRARREAAGAELLIVNQHLLLADLSVRYEVGDYKRALVLPPYQRIILDEAHHLEEVATSFISGRFSIRGLFRLLGRLISARSSRRSNEPRRGTLLQLERLLPTSGAPAALWERIARSISPGLERALDDLRIMVRDYLRELALQVQLELTEQAGNARTSSQLRVTPLLEQSPLWRELIVPRVQDLEVAITELHGRIGNLTRQLAKLPEPFLESEQQLLLEIEGARTKLQAYGLRLQQFLAGGENLVRWLEFERDDSAEAMVALCTSPIEVDGLLREMVFEPLKTVVLTSATLSVAGRFDYLSQRVGLAGVSPGRLTELNVDSPFDYARQVYLGIPSDFPEPRAQEYEQALVECVEEAILRSGGGAFVLFTSYALLNRVHDAVRARGRLVFPLLKHGEDQRHRLLARFKAEANAVLFGTDSFWEGVDVQGEALRLVIITRLPFQVPSEPVAEARAERVKERGGDPFRDISLPQAVIKFKQGFGRLIRHKDDRGVVLVLDQRIVSKFYGKHFLDSIPGCLPRVKPTAQVIEDLAMFYRGRLAPGNESLEPEGRSRRQRLDGLPVAADRPRFLPPWARSGGS